MAKRPSLFYGWIIVAIVFVSTTLIYGIRHSFAVFFPPILDEFGWSRGSTAVMFSLNILIYGVLAPLAGSLGERWKPKLVMLMGVTILGLATAGCAFANELWHFYLLFGILAPLGTAFCGWPLLGPALANWFAERRGLVMGLGQMGAGVSFAYGMFAEFAIIQLGWRPAYFVLAGLVVAVVLPLYMFLFQYRPERKGLEAYGTARLSAAKSSIVKVAEVENPMPRDWALGQALRTYHLWLLVLSHFLYWGIAYYMVWTHQVKFAEDVGYSSTFAASIFTLIGVCMVVGQLSSSVSDWVGREKTITLAAMLSIGAVVALISVRDIYQPWLLYVYAICFGYGAGLQMPTIYAGMADIFSGRHFGALGALLLTGMGIGSVIGPWLGGYIFDISGNYDSAFILCIVCFGIACMVFWIAAPRNAAKLRTKTLSVSQ